MTKADRKKISDAVQAGIGVVMDIQMSMSPVPFGLKVQDALNRLLAASKILEQSLESRE